jgi:hypothetical protein
MKYLHEKCESTGSHGTWTMLTAWPGLPPRPLSLLVNWSVLCGSGTGLLLLDVTFGQVF